MAHRKGRAGTVMNAESICFIPMEEKHLPFVCAVYNDYVLHSAATFHIRTQDPDGMRPLVIPPDPRYRSYIIARRDTPEGPWLGYACYMPYHPREAYEGTVSVALYLRPEHTGRGIGRLALAHLEAEAAKEGFHVLLAHISGDNTPSLTLFDRAGYRRCSHYHEIGQKFGRWLDVVAFEKILNL